MVRPHTSPPPFPSRITTNRPAACRLSVPRSRGILDLAVKQHMRTRTQTEAAGMDYILSDIQDWRVWLDIWPPVPPPFPWYKQLSTSSETLQTNKHLSLHSRFMLINLISFKTLSNWDISNVSLLNVIHIFVCKVVYLFTLNKMCFNFDVSRLYCHLKIQRVSFCCYGFTSLVGIFTFNCRQARKLFPNIY